MATVFLQASNPAFVSEGQDDDRYILTDALLAPGQNLTLVDALGANTLQLEPGLEIVASTSTSNFLELTLSNGAIVGIANANSFTFVTGATNTVLGTGGISEDFGTFVTSSLGLAQVSSNDAALSGGAVTVLDGGGTEVLTSLPVPTFAVSPEILAVAEGGTAEFVLSTTNVDAGTVLGYTLTGVSTADITGSLFGTVTVAADGTTDIAVGILADQLTEGPETLTLSLDNGLASADVSILDTSIAQSNIYISGLGQNGVVSDFNIEIVFDSPVTTAQRAAFEQAADYISTLIVGDIPDDGAIDDIRVTARLEDIDGPFGILGSAGPTDIRPGSFLPSEGRMRFDTADVDRELAEGTFVDTIAHEIMHTLGFGTIWDLVGLITSGPDLRFTGENAVAAYNAEFPGIAGTDANSAFGVPVETDFGPGTAGGHWDEETFTDELMTGFASNSAFTSAMTVASLEDLGYDTVFDISTPGAAMPQLHDFMFV